MRKKNKLVITVVSATTGIALLGSALFASGAANGGVWQLPTELQAGADAAAANPNTGAAVTIDRFDNVQKKIGEQAGLVDETTKKSYFTIAVTKTQLLGTCPSRMDGAKLRPTRSNFLVLDIEAALEKRVGEKTGGSADEIYMPLVAEAFSVVDGTGMISRSVSSETAWECYSDTVLAPTILNPGQKIKGKIVLDVSTTKGKVAYDPGEAGGWSWPFGN